MTQEQTRNLGIEFERRLQIAIPQLPKLDTETIYAYLNEAQILLVTQAADAAPVQQQDQKTTASAASTMQTVAQQMVRHKILSLPNDGSPIPTKEIITEDQWRLGYGDLMCKCYELPDDFLKYVRSSSLVSRTYKDRTFDTENLHILPNILVEESNVNKALQAPYNPGAIMRKPIAVLEHNNMDYIKIIYDVYTSLDGVDLTYYKIPYKFNVMNFDDGDMTIEAIHSYCELPYACFETLVEMALSLFMSHATAQQRGQNNKSDNKKQEQQ